RFAVLPGASPSSIPGLHTPPLTCKVRMKRAQCRNLQTGVTYVVYGAHTVSAPNIATTTCYSGNVAEVVVAAP
ncbi:hypothetical protein, partial [Micromonospora sp. NPDC023633]|uniref:hypothetical protein n=1 Tax=Micromonospora sp. NPDC023633 TaxID=3154320 RepID=UPI003410B1A9